MLLAGGDSDLLEMDDGGDMGTRVLVFGDGGAGNGGVLFVAGEGIVAGHGRKTTRSETQVGFWKRGSVQRKVGGDVEGSFGFFYIHILYIYISVLLAVATPMDGDCEGHNGNITCYVFYFLANINQFDWN